MKMKLFALKVYPFTLKFSELVELTSLTDALACKLNCLHEPASPNLCLLMISGAFFCGKQLINSIKTDSVSTSTTSLAVSIDDNVVHTYIGRPDNLILKLRTEIRFPVRQITEINLSLSQTVAEMN